MTYVPLYGDIFHISAKAKEVYDVTGAGDTVVAVIAACMRSKIDIRSAVELANLAGGIVVGKIGTAPINKEELYDVLEKNISSPIVSSEKCKTLPSLIELRKLFHKKGLTVGFTNGCFDLLHPGHIHILEEAKSLCDFLVVGLNSDDSISRLKGKDRPIQQQGARAKVLSALACVDAVVIFNEDTPYNLITSLQPDLIVKGADYTIDTVVGAKEVLSWGGKVHLVNLIPGQSTTRLVQKNVA